jgi:hypothetical protein
VIQSSSEDVDRWPRALRAAIIVSLLCAPVSWVDDGITPSWIVYPILLLVAWWRLRSGNGALMVGVVALAFLLVHLPFSWAAVSGADTSPSNPDLATSPIQWLVTLFVVPALTSTVGWITWLKSREASAISAP